MCQNLKNKDILLVFLLFISMEIFAFCEKPIVSNSRNLTQVEIMIEDDLEERVIAVYFGNEKVNIEKKRPRNVRVVNILANPGGHMVKWTVQRRKGWPGIVTFKQYITVPERANHFRVNINQDYIHTLTIDEN